MKELSTARLQCEPPPPGVHLAPHELGALLLVRFPSTGVHCIRRVGLFAVKRRANSSTAGSLAYDLHLRLPTIGIRTWLPLAATRARNQPRI
jgi:hypothetical protein